MAERLTLSGLRIAYPDNTTIQSAAETPGGLARGTSNTRAPGGDDWAYLLTEAGFEIVDSLRVSTPAPGALRAAPLATTIDVPVGAGQEAVILVESDGVYHWEFSAGDAPISPALRGPAGSSAKRFFLSAPPAAAGPGLAPTTRGPVFDWVTNTRAFRATVLRFLIGPSTAALAAKLDGEGPFGLCRMDGDDAAFWRPTGASPLTVPAASKKVLLFVHGTFSSTRGSFGDLLTHPEGLNFLLAARSHYDLIIGFDHPTLSVNVTQNAALLADELEKLNLPAGAAVDAIAYSRGGLALRSFLEQELPKRAGKLVIRPGRAIFIGCTNAGTHLAEPANWGSLVDLYTTLLLSAASATSVVPGVGSVTRFAATAVPVIGRLVQLMAKAGVDEDFVPGLASMKPAGAIVAALNRAEGKQRKPGYFAVTSNFEPGSIDAANSNLVLKTIDRVADDLFRSDNDLVVDTVSMTSFWPDIELDGVDEFGATHDVYHISYFTSPRVARKLMEWLDLPGEAAAAPSLQGEPAPTPTAKTIDLQKSLESILRGGGAPASIRTLDVDGFGPGTVRTRAAPPTGSRPLPTPSAAPDSEADLRGSLVSCDIAASMPPIINVGSDATLTVVLSRGTITVVAGPTSQSQRIELALAAPLTLRVLAVANCSVVEAGEIRFVTEREIEIPKIADATRIERFTVRPAETPGPARIVVSAIQNGRSALELELSPQVAQAAAGELKQTGSVLLGATPEPSTLLLRIYETRIGDKWALRFVADCPDAGINLDYSCDIAVDPSSYTRDRFADIERAVASSGDFAARMAKLTSHGAEMGDRMIPREVREAIWNNRGRIGAIQVISDETPIPWEIACIGGSETEDPIFLSEFGLVRWVKNVRWPSERLRLRDDNIRLLAPVYPGAWALPGAQQEIEDLKTLFPSAVRLTASRTEWSAFLRGNQPLDALHIACHGTVAGNATQTAGLFLSEKPDDVFDQIEIRQNLRLPADATSIVFLNACQTGRPGAGIAGIDGFAQAFLAPRYGAGASVVVAPLWSVGDLSARTFATTFYKRLLEKQPLVDAVREGRAEAKRQAELSWLAYSVYGDPFARVIA